MIGVGAATSLAPGRADLRELARPWKLLSFAAGMAWLLYGALNYGIGDWDVGDSLLMGGLTYLTAPWCVHTLWAALRNRPRGWPIWCLAALATAWAVVDASYLLYNTAVHHPVDRSTNFLASVPLYLLAGILWAHPGPLRGLWAGLRALGQGSH